ncbi:E3 ubiquitin-protein ligase RFI2 isoform X2 [Neltuma alba]|uniref:E3 ubiquitin-protein ligase RFI2 isoform X2 n=1 Tax=Neltuma alba TaxID=207710 RepID=UPI0010A3D0E0|nr:E3 ubiquitin-protein ligase RFI2-like isoform X2 [Prosopis alba]XP_028793742.1 E3 ubiquitin-protein ligase RFI2-like isoform X2 [Prosopis alba]
MGLGNDNDVVVDDGDEGGADTGGATKSFGSISCSICLEVVADNGDRSSAKLQCGHQFHLDCIGSAFNVKGAMQCPNCRKIEKGQWLYANGCRSYPEFSMDDWAHDEDLYDLSYSEMSFGVHWCPFGSLAPPPSSFEEGDLSSTAYHDVLGQHAMFAEHTAVSSASHPCPYIAYFGPVHPSSSNSGGTVSEASNYNHWNGSSLPTSSRVGTFDQPSLSTINQRPGRGGSDVPRSRSFMHPFLVGHSSAARAGSSLASSTIPPYPGSNARARDRVQALQAYYQQHQPTDLPAMRVPIVSGTRRSNGHNRGPAQLGQVTTSSDQIGFFFIPSGSSGRNFQEENHIASPFHARERDHLPSSSMNHTDWDSGWGAQHDAASGSDTGNRSSGFRLRNGSERLPSHNR